MNTLSWFLYWANILPYIAGWLVTFCVFSFCFSIVCTIIDIIERPNYDEKSKNTMNRFMKFSKIALPISVTLFLLSMFIPNTQTIYMIAGSQITEIAVTTPEAKEILEAIKNKINDYLKIEPRK